MRAVAFFALLTGLALAVPGAGRAAQDAFSNRAIEVPPAHGEFDGVTIDVLIDDAASAGTEQTPYWVFFAAGAMAVPLSMAPPIYGLGLLYPVFGPPLNAIFEAKREEMVRVVAAEPLPAAVLAALREQLRDARAGGPAEVRLAIGGYGLASRDGQGANVLFDIGAEFCLTARARLTITRPGRAPLVEILQMDVAATSPAPAPAICAPIGRFAEADGAYLRRSLRELAGVLAALVVRGLETRR